MNTNYIFNKGYNTNNMFREILLKDKIIKIFNNKIRKKKNTTNNLRRDRKPSDPLINSCSSKISKSPSFNFKNLKDLIFSY